MHLAFFSGLIGCIVVCDAVSKYFASLLLGGGKEIILIKNFLSFKYYENTGIAFSFPLEGILLKIVTLLLIFGIFSYYILSERKKKIWWGDFAFACILGGALGNAWERIGKGWVVDFISVEYFSVFNLADSAIFLGGCILIISTLFKK